MKRLILCNDGTWNSPTQEDNGILAPTNVVKLYNALAPQDHQGQPQTTYYHPGVGAEGHALDRITGGAVGTGISKHLRSARRRMIRAPSLSLPCWLRPKMHGARSFVMAVPSTRAPGWCCSLV